MTKSMGVTDWEESMLRWSGQSRRRFELVSQGITSGVNNTGGQLAGLLMIVVLPAVAGLSGKTFDSPEFADGYQVAMQGCALLSLLPAGIAGVTIRSR